MFPGTETGEDGYKPWVAPEPKPSMTREAFCHAVRALAVVSWPRLRLKASPVGLPVRQAGQGPG